MWTNRVKKSSGGQDGSLPPERRKMMQAWADYLDGLKAGAEVIPLFEQATN